MSLIITVKEAHDLMAKDSNGFSDPYVVLRLGKSKAKTEVKKKTLNPIWNQTLELSYDASDADHAELTCEIWDKDILSDDLLGIVIVDLAQSFAGTPKVENWYPLLPKKKNSKKAVSGELLLLMEKSSDAVERKRSKSRSESASKAKDAPEKVSKDDGKKIQIVDRPPAAPGEEPLPLLPHQKDRLAEMRTAGNVKTMKTTNVFDKPILERFFGLVQDVRPKISLINANTTELRSVYQHYFAATRESDRDDLSKQVEDILQQNSKLLSTVSNLMRDIESDNAKAEKAKSNTANESKVRRNVTIVVARAFMDALVEFQDLQLQFKTMHTSRVQQLYKISNPGASPGELKEIADMDLSVSDVFEQKFLNTRKKKAEEALAYVKAKHNEIISIERGLVELRELFYQVSALVSLQREFIDQISSNLDSTYESLKQANADLQKARYFQRHRFALSAPQFDKLYKT